MASFQDRVIGAMRLQATTFEEVEHDTAATSQAALVVAAAGLASGLAFVYYNPVGLVTAPIIQLIGWAISSFVVLIVGTKLFPGKNTEADMGQMLRALGFAQAPGLFSVLGIIPILGWLIVMAVWVWVLVATVIAVRQALDYDDTMKAVVVCVVAWLIQIFVSLLAAAMGIGTRAVGGMF